MDKKTLKVLAVGGVVGATFGAVVMYFIHRHKKREQYKLDADLLDEFFPDEWEGDALPPRDDEPVTKSWVSDTDVTTADTFDFDSDTDEFGESNAEVPDELE